MTETTQRPSRPPARQPDRLIWIGAAISIAIIVAALAAGWYYALDLGWPGFWAAIGAGMVALFGVFLFLTYARGEDPVRDEGKTLAEAAFESDTTARMIDRGGYPVRANPAWTALAQGADAVGLGGAIPDITRLFAAHRESPELAKTTRGAAALLYRLSHRREDAPRASEIIRTRDADGELQNFRVSVTGLGLGTGRLWQVETLPATEAGAQTLARAPIGLLSVDATGRVLATSPTLLRWLGREPANPPTRLGDIVLDPDVLLDGPTEPGRTLRTDTRLASAKQVTTPVLMSASWSVLDTGEPYAAIALYGHSSLGNARALPVAATGEVAGLTFDNSPVGIVELQGRDLSTATIRRTNPSLDAIAGTATVGAAFADLFDDAPRWLNTSANDCAPDAPRDAVLSSGTPVSAYIVCNPTDEDLCWAYLVDVSTRRSLEDQLIQSQKMQAIGQLAAGVAHDFNNLLTAIRLNVDELLGRHPVGDPAYPELQRINSTVMRAAALVKKLLAFSRKQTLRTQVLDVTETLSDAAMTLRQTLNERVRLDIVHGRGLPPIRADRDQLETVLINLCVNARDAMLGPNADGSDGSGGQIEIRTTQRKKTELDIAELRDIPAEDFVLITVSDTGTGMSDSVMAKIFEPFFTTKEQGKGTGLGLATVYGIVQQTGGHLSVESEVGVGTTFTIYLPAADPDAVEAAPRATAPAERAPSNLSGQGTILFVEDEESVRTIAAKTLRNRGYNVVEAGDGEEAYEWLEDTDAQVDLLISDVVMPAMDGPTLLRKARTRLGDARIVFISGYAEEEFSDLLSEEPDVTFLPKPFTLSELAEKVKAEIGEMS